MTSRSVEVGFVRMLSIYVCGFSRLILIAPRDV